jgi:hypothetical protein
MFFGPWIGSSADAPVWLRIAIVVVGVAVLGPGWVRFVRQASEEGERRRRAQGMRELEARAAELERRASRSRSQ